MERMIDCLFIGHNEMQFDEYEGIVRTMGVQSEAYRDLNMNFIKHENKLYTVSEAFNFFKNSEQGCNKGEKLSLGETFSTAIAYLGTYLHRRGLSYDYINSFQDEKNELAGKLAKGNIRAVAIITTLYIISYPIEEIVAFIKKHNSSVKIIVGGPFVATNVNSLEEPALNYLFASINADFYINSPQGETALVNILHALKEGTALNCIDNIFYRSCGEYVRTAASPENNLLHENTVDWTLFSDRIGDFAAVRTAISCPFSCAFCGFPQHTGKYQTIDVEAIERELNALDNIGRIKSVNFIDDTFNVPPQRFKDILRMMIKNQYSFKWHSYFRCQYADREMIELMKESGCEGVFLGIESGNSQVLSNMNKKADIEDYRKGMALLKEYGIITFASFIVGFPGETPETVSDTVNFIEESSPDFYRAQLWYCERITPVWELRDKYKISGSQFKWSHMTMDSVTGCKLIEDMFLKIRNSIWLPQYNFDFVNIFHLLHRGMSLKQVKGFIRGFNLGIREKLVNPKAGNISWNVLNAFNKAFADGEELEKKLVADFDF